MIKIKQAIIVEGKYDKIKLSSLVDATILVVNGFHIFKDKQTLEMIRILAKTSGIMIATDSDASGFKIRNFLKSAVTDGEVIHVYIPDILGKEKRKDSPSKEGKLGVEGIPPDILLDLFEKAGANGSVVTTASEKITKIHLFEDGLTGGPDSRQKRSVLLKNLRLPEHLSTNSLIPVLNSMMSLSEYKGLIHDISQN